MEYGCEGGRGGGGGEEGRLRLLGGDTVYLLMYCVNVEFMY